MRDKIKNRSGQLVVRPSLVLWCSDDGNIQRIEHDLCTLVTKGCNSHLADLVYHSSRNKALLFIKKLIDEAILLDWECTVKLGETLHPLKLSGIKADGNLLILADPEAISLQQIMIEIESICCLGGTALKALVERYGCHTSNVEPKNSRLYNEIIRLSNQQAALHRELAKKTSMLESRTTELRELNRVLSTITDGIQDSILLLNPEGKIIWANMAARTDRVESLIGCHCHQSMQDYDITCDTPDTTCPIIRALASGKVEYGEHSYPDGHGGITFNEVTIYPVFNDKGDISQLVRIAKDITKRKRLEDMLRQETMTDVLTDVPNRRAFEKHFSDEWRRAYRTKAPLTVAMIDIDLFKNYNDFYGHQQGDVCLRRVAKCIQKSLRRPGDLVARYGGEEFVMILPATDANNAATVTDAIQTNLKISAIPHKKSTVADFVTVSIGIATTIPALDSGPEKLLFIADKALYTAKRLGRNRVHRVARISLP